MFGGLDNRFHAVGRHEVAQCQRCLSALGLNVGSHALRSDSVATVNDYLDAFQSQHPGDLGADSGSAAGDQRALVGQLQIHLTVSSTSARVSLPRYVFTCILDRED